jgi:hypothetical protein
VADQGFGAAQRPAPIDHPRRGPALGGLDERRVLGADLGVEREQLVDPLLIGAVGKPVVEIPGARDRAGGPQRPDREVRMPGKHVELERRKPQVVLSRGHLAAGVDRATTVERALIDRRVLAGPQPQRLQLQAPLVDHLHQPCRRCDRSVPVMNTAASARRRRAAASPMPPEPAVTRARRPLRASIAGPGIVHPAEELAREAQMLLDTRSGQIDQLDGPLKIQRLSGLECGADGPAQHLEDDRPWFFAGIVLFRQFNAEG